MDKQIKLIVIDHLTILSPAQRSESRHREVTECMRTLKAMAKEIDIPILLLCQLSRKLEDRKDKRPQLADLRESGSIEEYSDIVMFLHRDEVYEDTTPDNDGKAEMLVKKHRNGPEGDVPLFFNKAVTRFESLAADDERGPF